MGILVIAATNLEIEGLMNKPGVEVLVTGVGCTATCYHLTRKLQDCTYDLLIQAGIAGSFENHIPAGEVVQVKEDCFGDLGMEEKNVFVPIFNTQLADPDTFPFSNGWLMNNYLVAGSENLRRVKAVTVNKITDNNIQKEQLLNHFDPQTESMEGAAFHYVALHEQIPFVQLRAITNVVGDRNKENWKFQEAILNLSAAINNIIEKNLAEKGGAK